MFTANIAYPHRLVGLFTHSIFAFLAVKETGHTRPRGYKLFFMINSAEHELFSANKYEHTNNSWHFHIYQQSNFHAHLCLARKNLQK